MKYQHQHHTALTIHGLLKKSPLQLVAVTYMIWGQCHVDIFLVDWERPPTGRQPTNQIAEQQVAVGGVVSIWRTYFVANEWNELQTLRRGLRPLTTLITVLLFLQVSCTHILKSIFFYWHCTTAGDWSETFGRA